MMINNILYPTRWQHALCSSWARLFGIPILINGMGWIVGNGLAWANPADPQWPSPPQAACHGTYQETPLPPVPDQTQIITCTSGTFQPHGWSTCQGQVHARSNQDELRADRVDFFRDNQGRVRHIKLYSGKQPAAWHHAGMHIFAEHAEIWLLPTSAFLENVEYYLYGRRGRGSARTAYEHAGEPLVLQDVRYTTCLPGQTSWHLRAKRLRLDRKTGRGQAYHAWLYADRYPVFYTPYASFPLGAEPQSGLLSPIYHQDPQHGSLLMIPGYMRFTGGWDTTWTVWGSQKRGHGLAQEWRYANPAVLHNTYIGIIPSDRPFARYQDQYLQFPLFADPRDPRQRALARASRHRISISDLHSFQWGPHWSGDWAYQFLSDDDLAEDYASVFPILDLQTPPAQGSQAAPMEINMGDKSYLVRRAQLRYAHEGTQFGVRIDTPRTLYRYNRPLLPEPYHVVPAVDWTHSWSYGPWVGETGLEWAQFQHISDPFTGIQPPIGHRAHAIPQLYLPLETRWGYIAARFQGDFRYYVLKRPPGDPAPHRIRQAIPMGQLETGWQWERPLAWGGTEPLIQTWEPSVLYTHIPWVDQDPIPNFDASPYGWDFGALSRMNRYSGADRVGDTQQIAWRVRSRFVADPSGIERASWGMGQIYYRYIPRIQLPGEWPLHGRQSPLLGQVQYRFHPAGALSWEAAYDMTRKTLAQSRALIDYQPEHRARVQAEYLFLHVPPPVLSPVSSLQEPPSTHQWSIAWTAPINQRFSLWGFWRYDMAQRRLLERFGGVGYVTCCWGFRAGLQEERVPRLTGRPHIHRFFAQVVLSGLASGDTGFQEYLSDRTRNWPDRFGKLP